jgi:hypothetical protein
VGRNRVRLLAKNAGPRTLRRYGLLMAGYDLSYVLFVALSERTLAPLKGRIAGLRDWRAYRRMGASGRREIDLPRPLGLRAALRRRSAWRRGGGTPPEREARFAATASPARR